MTTTSPEPVAQAPAEPIATADKSQETASPVESAIERAKLRIAEDEGGQQAGEAPGTAETPNESPETGEAGTSAGTPIKAPENWEKGLAEKFEALPSDDAKKLVLDIQKQLQGGFTKAMQSISEERKQYRDLAELGQRFEQDPKAVIQALAEAANVPVWLEQPGAEDAPPEFQTAQELADWATQQAVKKLSAQQREQQQAMQTEMRKKEFMGQLEKAARDYPDFVALKEPIIEAITRHKVDPHTAYKIAAFDANAKNGQLLAEANAKNAALEKELKSLKSKLTATPKAGINGSAIDRAGLSTVEKAMLKAKQRMAADGF